MKKMELVIMASALLLLVPVASWAQEKGSIELKSTAEVEVVGQNAKGEKEVKREVAAKVTPGSTVIYTTTYTNIGKQPATDVVITNPVPEHMTYVDKSATGKGTKIEYSVDNGKTYAAPEKLMIKDADGKVRKAGHQDYTAIKWKLIKPLAPGVKGTVAFRAKLK